jgi:hypothetical protein
MKSSDDSNAIDWRARLHSLPSGTKPTPRIVVFIFRAFLGLGLLLVAVFTLFCWAAFRDHIETGFHQHRVDWLPPTATDISFYRNSNLANTLAYEFHISRSDFEALARDRYWPVKPLEQRVSVIRYIQCLPSEHSQSNEPLWAETSVGLFFENRRGNGGGITVLFDDTDSMAYVFQSNR